MIIIFDDYYPMLNDVSFLNNEIEEIRRLDDKVLILPLFKPKEIVPKGENELFPNVYVSDIAYKHINPLIHVTICIKALLSKQLRMNMMDLFRNKLTISKVRKALMIALKTEEFYYNIKTSLRSQFDQISTIYSFWMYYNACVGARIKQIKPNILHISRAHGYDLYEFRENDGYIPSRRYIFTNTDFVCPVSEAGRKYLLSRYAYLNPNKVKTMYLGTFDHGLNPYSHTPIRIVSCSYLVPIKRVELIVSALSLVRDIDIEWIHFGGGPLLDELQNAAKTALGRNIHYEFKGHTQNYAIMEYYKHNSISFFINVSESEGLPVSIMESISFGIPVIATDVGGVGEIVVDDLNGVLVEKNIGSEALSHVIRKALLINKEKMLDLRKMARLRWEEMFNSEKNYKKFYDLIRSGSEY